jgi:hypothetical protein
MDKKYKLFANLPIMIDTGVLRSLKIYAPCLCTVSYKSATNVEVNTAGKHLGVFNLDTVLNAIL